jgi:hypothetical protein
MVMPQFVNCEFCFILGDGHAKNCKGDITMVWLSLSPSLLVLVLVVKKVLSKIQMRYFTHD